MSLRDWFAGMALQGIISNSDSEMLKVNMSEANRKGETHTSETYTRQAYEYADAMLKAREVKPCSKPVR